MLCFLVFLASITFLLGVNSQVNSEIELTISAENLKKKDFASKSDPRCVISLYNNEMRTWNVVFMTETVKNSHNPTFKERYITQFYFEKIQQLKFEIYDIDNFRTGEIKENNSLGYVDVLLTDIVMSSTHKLTLDLISHIPGRRTQGKITISAHKVMQNIDHLVLALSAKNIEKKDLFGFGKSDPYIEIHTLSEDHGWKFVGATNTVKNNINPKWKKLFLQMNTLCNLDFNRELWFKCYDGNKNNKSEFIGEFKTKVKDLFPEGWESNPSYFRVSSQDLNNDEKLIMGTDQSNHLHPKFVLINQKKLNNKKYNNSGEVHVEFIQILKSYTFYDYLSAGLLIHGTVAIDFTQSNEIGDLHGHRNGQNFYETAIISVVSVLEQYDSDQLFPVIGFGASFKNYPGRSVFGFAVNFNNDNPYCHRIDGILQSYHTCLRSINLSGPTNFAPVINNQIKNIAQQSVGPYNYFILLILTDGAITDMENTKDAIVKASYSPLSIIIVGIGNADFSNMHILDGDNNKIVSKTGLIAQRDIVQFVALRDLNTMNVAEKVLAEVPRQVISYFAQENIHPPPPGSSFQHQGPIQFKVQPEYYSLM